MNRKTAAARPRQAPMSAHSAGAANKMASMREGMELVLSVPVSLGASAFVGLGGNVHSRGSDGGRGRHLFAPLGDEKDHDRSANEKIEDGHQPRDQAEAGFGRLRIHGGAELLDESLRDFVFGVAAGHHGAKFLEHGSGNGAADVVALGEDLAAAAHAHEFAADLLNAVGLLLGKKRQNGEKDECEDGTD